MATQKIQTVTPDEESFLVQADVIGDMAVHRTHIGEGNFSDRSFTVTHVATGKCLGYAVTQAACFAFIEAVHAEGFDVGQMSEEARTHTADPNRRKRLYQLIKTYLKR